MENVKIDHDYECIIEFTSTGNAIVNINDKRIFIFSRNTLNSLNNDKVLVNVVKRGNKVEGVVKSVLERHKTQFVGRVIKNKNSIYVKPDNNKIHVMFSIIGDDVLYEDQRVVIELVSWKKGKSTPRGKLLKVIGKNGDNNTEMNAIMIEYGLPMEFPLMVEAEASLINGIITDYEISKRRDMRNESTFTIDPVDAKDFDDALSVSILDNDRYRIGIHIADVSHYVKEGSLVFDEAYKRGTSVYLVDRCVPMLPEILSNNLCSLRPNEDKLTFSVVLEMDANGIIYNKWFGKTITHSDNRFSYEEAQEIIDGGDGIFKEEILLLDSIAKKLRVERIKNGSVEMGSIEVKFMLDDDNKKPIDVYFKTQKDSNKLIEEFMLLANKLVAIELKDRGFPYVNRVHDRPDNDKLWEVKKIASNFGYDVDFSDDDKVKESINQLIKDLKGKPEENMISTLITRSQKKAIYSIDTEIGHYGLGFDGGEYSHYTSPIRRLSDYYIHKILHENKKYSNEELSKICSHISGRELVAARAERDSIKYKQAEYLNDKIGYVFDGMVSGISDFGFYVEIVENKCEGLIKIDNTMKSEPDKYRIKSKTGGYINLGDIIKVKIKAIDLNTRRIDFELF